MPTKPFLVARFMLLTASLCPLLRRKKQFPACPQEVYHLLEKREQPTSGVQVNKRKIVNTSNTNALELSNQWETHRSFQNTFILEKTYQISFFQPVHWGGETSPVMGPCLVLTKHLLDAFVLIIFFIPNYPELSGLEQMTTISLCLPILTIWNLDSEQRGVVSWLPVISAGPGASEMLSTCRMP